MLVYLSAQLFVSIRELRRPRSHCILQLGWLLSKAASCPVPAVVRRSVHSEFPGCSSAPSCWISAPVRSSTRREIFASSPGRTEF
ncbi:uncharacterized protein BO80DRAFT_420695 [Aspergillus ibericus CBS 121593]|uniref:Uncharacterized protein n=1 Tax=Aspergillus ibericus CBS 121593 TaxID=1448316 RepID=A0A395HGY2_9EURO|nr:hypothetical protein BO80DRAFT_420695 [Aspergillus ibericus CBS 121593]RAL06405.1 hypothetical protein BO80DRAFT_420695 [Aspergillus ibericus CBS 121593]